MPFWSSKRLTESALLKLELEEAWLVAQRASMRALPMVIEDERYFNEEEPFRTGLLTTLRANLVTEIQLWDSSYRVEVAARDTTQRAIEYILPKDKSSRLASEAAYSCTRMINRHTSAQPVTPASAWTACRTAIDAMKLQEIDGNAAILDDLTQIDQIGWRRLMGAALWQDSDPVWDASFRRFLSFLQDDKYWRFWNRWCTSVFIGQPANQHLMRRVALIEPHFWKYDEHFFEDRLVEAQEDFLFSEIALPERVVRDSETGLHTVIPYEYDDERKMQNALNKVRDAMEEFRHNSGGNMYSAMNDVLSTLDRSFQEYLDEPIRIHDDFLKCAKMIRGAVNANELPENDYKIESFLDDLTNGVFDIQSGDAFVSETISARAKQKFRPPSAIELESLQFEVEQRASVSDEKLRGYLKQDAGILRDLARDGSHSVLAEPEFAAYRLAARMPKIRLEKDANKSSPEATGSLEQVSRSADQVGKIMKTAETGGKWIDYFLSLFG